MKNPQAQIYTPSSLILSLIFALFLSSNVYADNADSHAKDYNKVFFSVSESTAVENDITTITFFHAAEGINAQDVSNQINQQMAKAFKALKPFPKVVKKTSQYRVNPVYKKSVISHWRGQQSLSLTMNNSDEVAKVLKQVQPYLAYQSMQFQVSSQRLDEINQGLTLEAIKKYQAKAKAIAKAFGLNKYKIIETRINTPNHNSPKVYARAEMAMASSNMAAPSISSGESKLSVTISGTLLLKNH